MVLKAEAKIRKGGNVDVDSLPLNRYWQDIIRLLQIFALSASERKEGIPRLKKKISVRVYDVYIEKRTRAATNQAVASTPVQERLL
jgi:thymidylate synthase